MGQNSIPVRHLKLPYKIPDTGNCLHLVKSWDKEVQLESSKHPGYCQGFWLSSTT